MMMTMSNQEGPATASEIFLYDHLGNRYQETAKNGFTYTYTHNSVNQYERKETNILGIPIEIDYSHDDNGNLQFDEHWNSYSYDYRNRLNKVEDYESNIVAEYAFDALGRRIRKTVNGVTTYFIYDLEGQVIAEYEDEVLTREFIYGNGFNEVLAMFLPQHEGNLEDWDAFIEFVESWLCIDPNDACYNGAYDHNSDSIVNLADFAYFAGVWDMPSNTESNWYYLHDALGSVRGIVGGRFNRESDREFYNYDVYGKSTDTSAVGNPFRFTGSRLDAETNLYHTPFRVYDPETGRWLQIDPIDYADSWNLYEYVMGNPAMYSDPLGLKKYDLLHGYEDIKDFWENTNDQQRRQYFSKIQKEIGHLIDATAKKHCIPKLLLAGLIANELMDLTSYELDTVENSWFWNTVKGYNQSYGPAQIKPSTVLDLKLLGTDFQYYTITYEVVLSPTFNHIQDIKKHSTPNYKGISKAIKDVETNVDVAGQLVKFYLDDLCIKAKSGQLSKSFKEDIAINTNPSGTMTTGFCSIQEFCVLGDGCKKPDCKEIVNMQVPECLLRSIAAMHNSGNWITGQDNIMGNRRTRPSYDMARAASGVSRYWKIFR